MHRYSTLRGVEPEFFDVLILVGSTPSSVSTARISDLLGYFNSTSWNPVLLVWDRPGECDSSRGVLTQQTLGFRSQKRTREEKDIWMRV